MTRHRVVLLVVVASVLSGCAGSSEGNSESASDSATTTLTPRTEPPTTLPALPPQGLGPGDTGEGVRFVETRLEKLRFDVGTVDDVFDDHTTFGVQAFQKLAGLPRDGRVTPPVLDNLARAESPPPLVPGGGPTRVEIDLPRQLLSSTRVTD